eukprot:Opistho-2@78332
MIDFIQTGEGRAVNMGGSYKYEYNLSDHLGNVRYSFDIYQGNVRRLQSDDYYAFGMRKPGTPIAGNNKYLYNGKELQEELLGQYDYGARFYDPVIGRWNVVDPLAEGRAWMTPYHYTSNNPINRIDPDGRWDWVKEGNTWKWDEDITSAEQAKAAGYDDYRAPGSIIEGAKIGSEGKVGDILLGNNASDAFYVMKPVEISGRSTSSENENTPWMPIATSQLGVRESTGKNDGVAVDKYLATAGLKGSQLPWCGCFTNWSMETAGINGVNGPARALNWRNFGDSLDQPAYGSIGTLTRPGGGHVGFVVAKDGNRPDWIVLLGGNQSDAVTYRSFPRSVMKFNYPSGYTPNYSLPTMSHIRPGVKMH